MEKNSAEFGITQTGAHTYRIEGKAYTINNEKTQEARDRIQSIIDQGCTASIEESLYCEYEYDDCITAGRCNNCGLTSYRRDCNNNIVPA